MAISKEQLASIISGRAAQLCSPEGTRLIESHTGKQGIRGDFNNPDPSAYYQMHMHHHRMQMGQGY